MLEKETNRTRERENKTKKKNVSRWSCVACELHPSLMTPFFPVKKKKTNVKNKRLEKVGWNVTPSKHVWQRPPFLPSHLVGGSAQICTNYVDVTKLGCLIDLLAFFKKKKQNKIFDFFPFFLFQKKKKSDFLIKLFTPTSRVLFFPFNFFFFFCSCPTLDP